MRTRSFARLAVLLAVASLAAGCAARDGDDDPPGRPLQLRLVTSSADGACTAPALTTDGPGTACDIARTTTYQLAESLGVVTPTSVVRQDQGAGQTVMVEFDKADTGTLGDVTGKAIDKQLALLVDGMVIAAATVMDPITDGTFTFGFGTDAEAERAAEALRGSPSP